MIKKIKSFVLVISLMLVGVLAFGDEVLAGSNGEIQIENGTSQGQNNMNIGYIEKLPRGMYLQSGYSSISKAGEGLITAGGATLAQRVVDDISICVELQKLESNGWATIEIWSVEKKNDTSVMTSKTFKVEPGLYRVSSIHSANTDSSGSTTDAMYIS